LELILEFTHRSVRR